TSPACTSSCRSWSSRERSGRPRWCGASRAPGGAPRPGGWPRASPCCSARPRSAWARAPGRSRAASSSCPRSPWPEPSPPPPGPGATSRRASHPRWRSRSSGWPAGACRTCSSSARPSRSRRWRTRGPSSLKVEPGAVVITTEDVGRPAENIEYYSGVAHALYLTDLERWGLTVGDAAELLARGGMRPYLLLPKAHPGLDPLLAALGRRFAVELAADIPARRAVDYFVAAQFLPEGIHMQLHRLGPLA